MTTRTEISRRGFLAHAAAAAVTLPLLARSNVHAKEAAAPPAPAPLPAPKVLVDWHNHWVSKAEIQHLAARHSAPRIITAAGRDHAPGERRHRIVCGIDDAEPVLTLGHRRAPAQPRCQWLSRIRCSRTP